MKLVCLSSSHELFPEFNSSKTVHFTAGIVLSSLVEDELMNLISRFDIKSILFLRTDLNFTNFDILELSLYFITQPSFRFNYARVFILNTADEFLDQCDIQNQEIVIIGPTNVGKSTILNALMKINASVVSDSFFTTSGIVRVRSVVDTEGFVKGTMTKTLQFLKEILIPTNLICIVVDESTFKSRSVQKLFGHCYDLQLSFVVVFNKSDLVSRYNRDRYSVFLSRSLINNDVFFLSAIDNRDVDSLRSKLHGILRNRSVTVHSTGFLTKIAPFKQILYIRQITDNQYKFAIKIKEKQTVSPQLIKTLKRTLSKKLNIKNMPIKLSFY